MSFSSELKAELGKAADTARHCRIAQLAAFVCFLGKTVSGEDGLRELKIVSENTAAFDSAAELLKKIFAFKFEVGKARSLRNLKSYSIELDASDSAEVFETLKFGESGLPNIPLLTEKSCCKKAFLRGAFLAAGSVSNPDRSYHFEIMCKNGCIADMTAKVMCDLGLQAKITPRQKHFVVYLKEIEQISDALGMMGARTSLLELENFRILREMRGNVNRRVNCETANINKAAQAAARQIEDIKYIESHMRLSSLPNGLDEIARIRLEYPEATLSELGAYLEPPVGKSGVNHRLRKISSIAEALRSRGGKLL